MGRFAALGVTLALPNEATHAALPDSGLTDRNQFPNLIRANTKAAIIKRRKRPLPRPGHCWCVSVIITITGRHLEPPTQQTWSSAQAEHIL